MPPANGWVLRATPKDGRLGLGGDLLMARGRLVIVEDSAVALIERNRDGRRYYVFPGGGAEPGESLQEAAKREAREELGLEVAVGDLLFADEFEGEVNAFFAARVRGGVFGSGTGDELAAAAGPPSGSYAPVWVPLARLRELPVFPEAVAALITPDAGGDLPGGWGS
jgi:8-oxo-dGTP diphosphatase